MFDQRTMLDQDPYTGTEFYEVISHTAFDDCDMSDVVLNVDHEGAPIARTRAGNLMLSVDGHGLRVTATLTTTRGREIWEEIRAGNLTKMSFAFNVAEESYCKSDRTRTITKISKLWDVSVVTFPAYEQTCVFARSAMAGHIAEEQRAYVAGKMAEMRNVNLPDLPTDRRGNEWAGLEMDIAKLKGMEQRARDVMQWEPEGTPEDVNAVNEKSQTLSDILAEIESLNNEVEERIRDVENHKVMMYGWKPDQVCPNNEDQIRALAKRGIPLKIINGIPRELLALYDSVNPRYNYSSRGKSPEIMLGRSKNSMSEIEKRDFYNKLIEERAAGTTSTMTNVIPTTILDQYILEKAPGAFLEDATKTNIAHSGNLVIPVSTLQTVAEHTENAELTVNGFVPGKLTIEHSEYAYVTGYSDLGARIDIESMSTIVSNTLLSSMMKAMDGVCLAAAAGLTYTDGTNAVELATGTAPTFADFVELAGLLGPDFIDGAKWYMSSATFFGWMLGMKDDQKRPIFDASKRVSEQAPFGFPIRIDSQVPANTVYFGDGSRVHLNYARSPEIYLWTDYDHNTDKAGVRTVAGAACETGAFVKMSVAAG